MIASSTTLSTRTTDSTLHSMWPLAWLAVVLPTAWPFHQSPSITFYNQMLAVLGWGLWTLALAWAGRHQASTATPHSHSMTAASLVMWLMAGAALGSAWASGLPWGLALMAAGMALSAWWVMHTAWQAAQPSHAAQLMDAFALALACAGVLGVVLGGIQIFMPAWTDGDLIARSAKAGTAVGNLRQPNHLSTLLVLATCGSVWLGRRGKWPLWLSVGLTLACIAGVVGTASRTGMLGMGLLLLWGWRDRGLPKPLRTVLLAAPLAYGLFWGALWWWAQAGAGHAFAGQARLHDGSDISSSRFKIWSDTLHLIGNQPWTGVGWGQFNLAWTFTELPNRPVAFFDHTHNIIMQWAVELGVPMAALLVGLCAMGLWPLLKAFIGRPLPDEQQGVRLVSATMLGILGLHSLLEYPLWYSYFLLPCAFAWGLGLAASLPPPEPQTLPVDTSISRTPWWQTPAAVIPSVLMLAGTLWCVTDYQSAAAIYAPSGNAGPLSTRIETGRGKLWFGHQADYAWVTDDPEDTPSQPPAAFRRTARNLMDARLMVAYARALAAHGQVDKARYVVQRLREFRHPMGKAFMAPCDAPNLAVKPFQCTPPDRHYSWREVAP